MTGNARKGPMKRGSTLVASLVAPLVLSGCLGGSSGSSGGSDAAPCSEFDCRNMLQSLNSNVMEPAIADFESEADKLVTEARAYRDTLNSEAFETDAAKNARSSAEQAWESAMLVWQEIEMMQIGPLKDNSGALRDAVYSWPATSECGLDKEIVKANEESGYDITTRTALRKGLNGIEYALFRENLDASAGCTGDEIDTWKNDLDDQQRAEYRAEYVATAAKAVADRGAELNQKWTGDNGFATELTNPGSEESRFDSAQDAVNAVSDALFYFEKQTKDIKIAEPLCGEKTNCPDSGQPDVEKVENPYSNRSKAHINQNFIAFQTLFLGNREGEASQPGFDDFLDAINSEEDGKTVSSMMETDIQQAIDDLSRVNGTLVEALGTTSGEDSVRDVWQSAQDVTDRLKNDFLAVLGLSIPDAAAGDGD